MPMKRRVTTWRCMDMPRGSEYVFTRVYICVCARVHASVCACVRAYDERDKASFLR